MPTFKSSTYADYDKFKEYRKNQRARERERIKLYVESMKTECLFCGSTDNLEFHHVNSTEKNTEVASLKSKTKINKEVEKCWCLCNSCHKKLHQRLCDPLPGTYDTRHSVPTAP